MPFSMPQPNWPGRKDPARDARVLRVIAWAVLIGALTAAVVQLEATVLHNQGKLRNYEKALAAGQLAPGTPAPKGHKGAIGRWARAVRAMWDGQNIYITYEDWLARRSADASGAPTAAGDSGNANRAGPIILHPNMPFIVILLTPFGYLPVSVSALIFSILKVLAILAAILAATRVANHDGRRMPDWVVGLAVACCLPFLLSDIQHGNTNGLVLALIVLHLWLFRRGRDVLAGGALAMAICLKMTPALFVLYWLSQRNWKLLGGTVAAGLLAVVAVPAACLGPSRAWLLTDTWLHNLIFKGVGGGWYPIHINQSVLGVMSRYLLEGPEGNYLWNSDDNPYDYQRQFGWINLASLSPMTVKWLIRGVQALLGGLGAWAIGLRRLPRQDGRRCLHYGIVALLILLLNQRTWDHHAAILLPTCLAAWYAIAYGRISRRARVASLSVLLAAILLRVLTLGELVVFYGRLAGSADPRAWADRFDAYGPTFFHFLLLLVTMVILAVAMKRHPADTLTDPDTTPQPYATTRQKLNAQLDAR